MGYPWYRTMARPPVMGVQKIQFLPQTLPNGRMLDTRAEPEVWWAPYDKSSCFLRIRPFRVSIRTGAKIWATSACEAHSPCPEALTGRTAGHDEGKKGFKRSATAMEDRLGGTRSREVASRAGGL